MPLCATSPPALCWANALPPDGGAAALLSGCNSGPAGCAKPAVKTGRSGGCMLLAPPALRRGTTLCRRCVVSAVWLLRSTLCVSACMMQTFIMRACQHLRGRKHHEQHVQAHVLAMLRRAPAVCAAATRTGIGEYTGCTGVRSLPPSPKLLISTLASGLLFSKLSGNADSLLPPAESGADPVCTGAPRRPSRDAAERDLRRPEPGGTLRRTPPTVQYLWHSCTRGKRSVARGASLPAQTAGAPRQRTWDA